MSQKVYKDIDKLYEILSKYGSVYIIRNMLNDFIKAVESEINIDKNVFYNFTANAKYEEVLRCKHRMPEPTDIILAIGGGSAIDMAKNVKHITEKELPIIAIPTTTGSGSESTKFAVLYKDGVKTSIESDNLIPEYVILEPRFTYTMPRDVAIDSCIDTLSHGIESYWSKNRTKESIKMSEKVIKICMKYMLPAIEGSHQAKANMQIASNLAGKAINITKTAGAHAISYIITSKYGLTHGRALSITLPIIFNVNRKYTDIERLVKLEDITTMFVSLGLKINLESNKIDKELIINNFNEERMKNNPVDIDKNKLRKILEYIV